MCGIAGTAGFGDLELLRAMTDSIVHRGPDGEGFYVGEGVCLGNRRLSILDIPGGAQPMTNEDGSIVVIYNGETYNYPALREHVLRRGHTLQTTCDTEIIAHLYEDEGIDCVQRLDGMFALAVFDRSERRLFVVRDPIGIKPLVYSAKGGRLAFGSEAKAVLASGLLSASVDEASLHFSMNVRYIPGERTLFREVYRLPPGHYLEYHDGDMRVRKYSSIDWTPDRTRSRGEWHEGIRDGLQRSVQRHLLSDRPVGVSLSGGIDSSSIVAMLRRTEAGPIKTFTLGFGEPWDELGDARFVAERFETDHHEMVLREPVLPYLADSIRHTEEPKVNSLQLYLLHRFLGEHVTVALSGLGGDELFAGYDIYGYLARSRRLREHPLGLAVRAASPVLEGTARSLTRLGRPQLDLTSRKLEWLASLDDPARHYLLLRNAWDLNHCLLSRVYSDEFVDRLTTAVRDEYDRYFDGVGQIEREALRAEFSTKMVSDLLHNEDTMSMAHSVESRVPLLDLDFVRFAARIPDDLRFGRGMKGMLKDALRGVLPDQVLDKRKWGFTFDPVEQFGKDLEPMAREVLTPERLRRSGVFNPDFVAGVLAASPHQRLRWHYFLLWQMIGFELWSDIFLEGPSAARGRVPTGSPPAGEGG